MKLCIPRLTYANFQQKNFMMINAIINVLFSTSNMAIFQTVTLRLQSSAPHLQVGGGGGGELTPLPLHPNYAGGNCRESGNYLGLE